MRGCLLICALLWTMQAAAETSVRAQYHGNKFGISVDYTVQITRHDAGTSMPSWMQLPEDKQTQTRSLAPAQAWIHISTRQRIFGSTVSTDSVLQEQGLAIARIVGRERKTYTSYKATQYGSTGIRLLRLRHSADELPTDWQSATSAPFLYPQGFENGARVSDTSALFYLLNKPELRNPGGRLQFPVFSDDDLLQVDMRAADLVTTNTRYIRNMDGSQQQMKGKQEALRVFVNAQPLSPDASTKGISVLGLEGELELLVDRAHHLPLTISGRVPWLGNVKVRLRHLDIKDNQHQLPPE